jgi:hypothetical protein
MVVNQNTVLWYKFTAGKEASLINRKSVSVWEFVLKSSKTLIFKQKISATSTKVGELNSTSYAEFKYVLSFSLSRKVFKLHTVII